MDYYTQVMVGLIIGAVVFHIVIFIIHMLLTTGVAIYYNAVIPGSPYHQEYLEVKEEFKQFCRGDYKAILSGGTVIPNTTGFLRSGPDNKEKKGDIVQDCNVNKDDSLSNNDGKPQRKLDSCTSVEDVNNILSNGDGVRVENTQNHAVVLDHIVKVRAYNNVNI
ncbi:hypothetical protein [Ehrlichia ruminantium]|nr:hypothetical protein [Ehrlichia ruminantium]